MVEQHVQRPDTPPSSCNVSSTFNFTAGAVSIVVAAVIGYLLWQWMR